MVRTQAPILSFSEAIAATHEPNRPSGGSKTIDEIVQHANLPPSPNVLEIGCATGYTCLEIAACRPDAFVHGVDLQEESIAAARAEAAEAGIRNVHFSVQDARALDFPSGTFDLVSCGNVPAFVSDRAGLIAECARVVRRHGVIAAVPIYYVNEPPEAIRLEIQRVVGAAIEVWDESYWRHLYEASGLTLRHVERYRFEQVSPDEIASYASLVMSQPTNSHLSTDQRDGLQSSLEYFYHLFNENNVHAAYSVMLFRTLAVNRTETLFRTYRLNERTYGP